MHNVRTHTVSQSASWLLVLFATLLLAGCFEIRHTITFRSDGSGAQETEFVAVKRELDQLGPNAAKEIEDKFRADLQEKIAQDPSAKSMQLREYVDEHGNRVFNIREDFLNVKEISKDSLDCDWNVVDRGFMKKGYQLRCQFIKAQSMEQGPFKVPFKLRIQMPGTIVSTNGQKRSDNEAEWIFMGGWRRGAVFEAGAEDSGLPANLISIASGSVLIVLLAGAGFWYLRRRRTAAATRRSPPTLKSEGANANPGALNCPACGTENAPQARFCRSCGAKLALAAGGTPAAVTAQELMAICPKCDAPNLRSAKFCKACGSPIGAVVVPTAPAAAPPAAVEPPPTAARLRSATQDATATSPVPRTPATPPSIPAARREMESARSESAAPVSKPVVTTARTVRFAKPAIAAVLLAAIGIGGWYGYSHWRSGPAPQAEAPASPRAPAPQVEPTPGPQASAPTVQLPASATPAPAVATSVPPAPPVPMALDVASNCYVWKPNIQPNESVKWNGACVNGLADGSGIAEWSVDGAVSIVYTGGFKGGMLEGRGTMGTAGGDRFQGEYRDGRREGQGTYVAASGERYEGAWRDNKREGRGVLTYASGDRYEGDFKDNKRDGLGVYTKPDGERYQGEYRDDRREGHGALVRADGTRYDGPFKEGKPLGNMSQPTPVAKATPPQPALKQQAAPPTVPAPRVEPPRAAASPPAALVPQPQTRPAPQVAAAPPESALDPAKLEGDLNRALRGRDVRGVTAQVGDDGVVTLKGSANAADKDRALQLARTFRGVKSVKDQVFVVE